MTQPYGNYQIEIYFQGLTGVQPSLPMSFDGAGSPRRASTLTVGVVLCRRRSR